MDFDIFEEPFVYYEQEFVRKSQTGGGGGRKKKTAKVFEEFDDLFDNIFAEQSGEKSN